MVSTLTGKFRRLFLGQYWDVWKKAETRNRIMNGPYNLKRDGSTSKHFIKMALLAIFPEPPIGFQELISLVTGHFPSNIRSAIIVSRPNL